MINFRVIYIYLITLKELKRMQLQLPLSEFEYNSAEMFLWSCLYCVTNPPNCFAGGPTTPPPSSALLKSQQILAQFNAINSITRRLTTNPALPNAIPTYSGTGPTTQPLSKAQHNGIPTGHFWGLVEGL